MREADYLACRHLLEKGSRSFAMASRLLPERIVRPATAFYAFCRVADDLIDLGESPERASPVCASGSRRWLRASPSITRRIAPSRA